MRERLEDLLARCTLSVQSSTPGTAFVAQPGIALTCAHVLKGHRVGDDVPVRNREYTGRARIERLDLESDVAVLAVPNTDLPHVRLAGEPAIGAALYVYGFPQVVQALRGDSIAPRYEGPTHPDPYAGRYLLKLAAGQVEPGFSGAPVLDLDSGTVCGMIRTSRDRLADLGGRAVPARLLVEMLPTLAESSVVRQRWQLALAARTAPAETLSANETPATDLPFSGRIEHFLRDYLGAPGDPRPFGGREGELTALDEWLETPSNPPALLVVGPAGRGKTALLVHWFRALLERRLIARNAGQVDEAWQVVFFPISIRRSTNSAVVAFHALSGLLAQARGEAMPQVLGQGAEGWKDAVATQLRRPMPAGTRLVLIIDALDEALDWDATSELFPARWPDGLRVVVSARLTERRPTPNHWLRDLGWAPGVAAQAMKLSTLSESGIQDVLLRMDFPLDRLAQRKEIIGELARLTEGDPLLVGLYAQDLWTKGESVLRYSVDDLKALKPGLEEYLDRWWREQEQLWGDSARPRAAAARTVLNVLSMALGPIPRRDIETVARHNVRVDTGNVGDAIRALERFLARDEQTDSVVFNHPRLAEFYQRRLVADGEDRQWDSAFVAWGLESSAKVERREIEPKDASRYVVLHVGAHLDRGRSPLSKYESLLTDGWRQLWQHQDRTYSGFLTDVDRVIATADVDDRCDLSRGSRIALVTKAVLAYATIATMAEQVPPRLVARLVESGLQSADVTAASAARITSASSRIRTLLELSRVAKAEEVRPLRQRAIAELWALSDADEIARIAREIADLDPAIAFEHADDLFLRLRTEPHRAEFLEQLIGMWPANDVSAALALIRKYATDGRHRSDLLATLAYRSPQSQDACLRALAAESTLDRFPGVHRLGRVLTDQTASLWYECIPHTEDEFEGWPRRYNLVGFAASIESLVGRWLGDRDAFVVSIYLTLFRAVPANARPALLNEIVVDNSRPLRAQKLAAAGWISDGSTAETLLKSFTFDDTPELAAIGATGIARVNDQRARGAVFRGVFVHRTHSVLLIPAVASAEGYGPVAIRAVLKAVRNVSIDDLRVDLLLRAAECLVADRPRLAFEAWRLIVRAEHADVDLVRRLVGVAPRRLHAEVWRFAEERGLIRDANLRVALLTVSGPELGEDVVARATIAPRHQYLANSVAIVAPFLSPNAAEHAWAVGRAVDEERIQASIWVAVAPRLPRERRIEAAREARGMSSALQRARVLASLAHGAAEGDRNLMFHEAILHLARATVQLPLDRDHVEQVLRASFGTAPAPDIYRALVSVAGLLELRRHELAKEFATSLRPDDLVDLLQIPIAPSQSDVRQIVAREAAPRLAADTILGWISLGRISEEAAMTLFVPALSDDHALEVLAAIAPRNAPVPTGDVLSAITRLAAVGSSESPDRIATYALALPDLGTALEIIDARFPKLDAKERQNGLETLLGRAERIGDHVSVGMCFETLLAQLPRTSVPDMARSVLTALKGSRSGDLKITVAQLTWRAMVRDLSADEVDAVAIVTQVAPNEFGTLNFSIRVTEASHELPALAMELLNNSPAAWMDMTALAQRGRTDGISLLLRMASAAVVDEVIVAVLGQVASMSPSTRQLDTAVNLADRVHSEPARKRLRNQLVSRRNPAAPPEDEPSHQSELPTAADSVQPADESPATYSTSVNPADGAEADNTLQWLAAKGSEDSDRSIAKLREIVATRRYREQDPLLEAAIAAVCSDRRVANQLLRTTKNPYGRYRLGLYLATRIEGAASRALHWAGAMLDGEAVAGRSRAALVRQAITILPGDVRSALFERPVAAGLSVLILYAWPELTPDERRTGVALIASALDSWANTEPQDTLGVMLALGTAGSEGSDPEELKDPLDRAFASALPHIEPLHVEELIRAAFTHTGATIASHLVMIVALFGNDTQLARCLSAATNRAEPYHRPTRYRALVYAAWRRIPGADTELRKALPSLKANRRSEVLQLLPEIALASRMLDGGESVGGIARSLGHVTAWWP